VPKTPPNAVALNIYYPHIEVWESFTPGYSPYYPDIITILTLDTLLRKYYVSTVPQDLTCFSSTTFLFYDGIYGKYAICNDTNIRFGFDTCICSYCHEWLPQGTSSTILSPDSILIKWMHGPGELSVIRIYLFIRQNSNF
jgi:hypothetical protein